MLFGPVSGALVFRQVASQQKILVLKRRVACFYIVIEMESILVHTSMELCDSKAARIRQCAHIKLQSSTRMKPRIAIVYYLD